MMMTAFLIIISIVAGIVLILFTGGWITQRFVRTPPFRDDYGDKPGESISEFRRVAINGDHHSLIIRGKNMNNPVLLFLHAGPCLSETGLMRNFNSELENFYTLVYYDMRGSAKSFSILQNYKKTFKTEIILQDIHEMTAYLKTHLNKEKIVLAGHSFGAGFGAMAACKYPNDYSAFIGIGQAANVSEINRMSWLWVLDIAEKNNNNKAVVELKKAERYWEVDDKKEYFKKMMIHKKWIGYYGGQLVGKTGFISFVMKNMLCKEYNIFDYAPFMLGMMAGGPASFEIMKTTDLTKNVVHFKQPVYFITGEKDYNAVPDLVRGYFELIHSPLKKMYWLKNSAHFPHIEEPELFQKIMIGEILPEVY